MGTGAVLQTHRANTGKDIYEILSAVLESGFDRLPSSDDGDLFFETIDILVVPPYNVQVNYLQSLLPDIKYNYAKNKSK